MAGTNERLQFGTVHDPVRRNVHEVILFVVISMIVELTQSCKSAKRPRHTSMSTINA